MDEEDVIIGTWLFSELQIEDNNEESSEAPKMALDVDKLSTKINLMYAHYLSQINESSVAYADSKSNDGARIFREAGIRLFKEENYEKALMSHTQCLATALENSEEMFKAYDERSLVLFKMGRYESCLLDVNRALKANCPKKWERKFRNRKRDCLANYRREKGYAMKSEAMNPQELADRKLGADWRELCNFDTPNKFLPNTSSKVQFYPDADEGRVWGSSLRATKDIEPGEILSVEEHYAMVLGIEQRFKRCAYCLIQCDALIPCPSCTQTVYCSEMCRSSAYKLYHRTECKLIKFYDRESAGWGEPLALRTFLRGTAQGTELATLADILKPKDIFEPLGYLKHKAYSLDYVAVLKLYSLFDAQTMASMTEALLPTIIEMILALRNLSFFPVNDEPIPGRLSEIELFAALLLVNNMVLLGIPNFRVWGTESKAGPEPEKMIIGLGVYVLQSLLSHSCNPNTEIFIEDRLRVLYATQPIKAGEPLFFAFRHLYSYTSTPKEDRPSWCKCEACMNNWPPAKDLQKGDERFSAEIDKKKLRETFDAKIKAITTNRRFIELARTEILQIIIELVKVWYNNAETKPSYNLILCEEKLIQAMDAFYSDHFTSEMSLLSLVPELIQRLAAFQVETEDESNL